MKHDEEKIQEIIDKCESWTDSIKEYADHVRNKTIDECILALPDKLKGARKGSDNMYEIAEQNGFNACILEARINMEKLY